MGNRGTLPVTIAIPKLPASRAPALGMTRSFSSPAACRLLIAAASSYAFCGILSSASRTTRSSVSASNGFVSSASSGDIVARAESDA